MVRLAWSAAAIILMAATAASAQLASRLVASGLARPVAFVQHPTLPDVQLIVEQGGRIRVLQNGTLAGDYLNVTPFISSTGERGLLGLAFAPDFATSRRVFVSFTNTAGDSVIARYRQHTDTVVALDPATRFDLMWPGGNRFLVQPYANHNGGHLAFGPDGYLYVGLGDGGSGGDPDHNAQDPTTPLGKMLRLNVSVADTDVEGYDIPPTNPTGVPTGTLPEIWAFGLRNPWRYSFDDPARGGTGALVIGDVGQNAWEEIDYEPAGKGGRNYGWRNQEGTHAYDTSLPLAYSPPTFPIFDYPHSVGASITGGFVYRGTDLGAVYRGRYFFADFSFSRVWSLALTIGPGGEASASDLLEHTSELGAGASSPSSFGLDASGELYVVNYGGTVHKIVSAATLDLNGDGRGDVFTYGPTSGPWAFRHSAASAGFTGGGPAGSWAAGWDVAAARFNVDPLTDLFLFSPTTGRWFKMTNTGAGLTQQATGTWWPGWQRHILDLDGDGISDVFLYDPASGQWFKCLSTPTGFSYVTGWWSPGWDVTALNLDRDWADDLFLINRTTGRWFWALSQPGGGFTYPQTGYWAPDWALYPGDFDGDGLDDLFLYRETAGQYYVALNTGAGYTYTSGGGWATGWTPTVLDLDADLEADLLLYNRTTGRWFELLGDGAGHFSVAGTGVWATEWDVHPTDFNDDGRADLFLYDQTTGFWYQARNLTLGTFSYSSGFWGPGLTIVTGPVGR